VVVASEALLLCAQERGGRSTNSEEKELRGNSRVMEDPRGDGLGATLEMEQQ
jgi:hypothetical protein